MNYTIKSAEKKIRVPEVGEIWRHKGDDELWMRIESGRVDKNFGWNVAFYSVNLKTGKIQWTSKDSKSFEVSSSVVEFEF